MFRSRQSSSCVERWNIEEEVQLRALPETQGENRRVYDHWKKGKATQEDYKDVMRFCREKIRRTKDQQELNNFDYRKNIQNNTKTTTKPNKTSLFKYICNRRIVIENFHPLFIALGNKRWGQDKPAFSCVRRSWDWILWRLHQTGCPSLKQASQGSGWITWRYLTDTKMSHVGTWFGGVLGSVGLEVGFYGLRGCVQPNGFYDSI